MEFVFSGTERTRPHHKHWQFCIGSCHAALAHRTDYVKQLEFIHRELGIERVRFHGIFNDDMKVVTNLRRHLPLPGSKKFGDVSFYQVGKVLDNVLSTGMKPFIEIGFMPELLASGKKQVAFSYKGNITPPKDYSRWRQFIGSFIEFLIRRYGREEVTGWYFEVWNEPNLSVFFSGNMQDYFRLYAETARAIKSVDSGIRVGGPSTATSSWIPEFTAFCKRESVPVDFVSTHQYAGEPIGHVLSRGQILKMLMAAVKRIRSSSGGSLLEGFRQVFTDTSEDEDIGRTTFQDNAGHVREAAGGLPVYYTEWNLSATCTAPKNDTRQVAAYIIKSVMDLENVLAGSSFWCFSDLFEELAFFPDPFSGSFGLLTVDGIPKPAFYAFKLLSMLRGERVELPCTNEETELAAFRSDESRQFLLYRQMHHQAELPATPTVLRVPCDQIPSSVTVLKIDEEHCNPLKVWQEMGSPRELLPADVEEIIQKSSLKEEELAFTFEQGCLRVETQLGINDVQLITVR